MLGATIGTYRIVRQIGVGGMGAVYAAEHVLLGRPAAVKVLLPEHCRDPQTVNRFFNEARAATAIRNPGIVEIYDYGYGPDGCAYIAMALLDGQGLGDRMKRGPIGLAAALSIARQIAGALAAAHDAGIVHRDLKPDNVFIVPDGEVVGGERIKLLDFGIAKLAQEASAHPHTHTGTVLGTPTYMAPEQCRGVVVDHRVDLYALGCIVFEMLSGRPPFVGEGMGDVLAAHIHVPPPALRTVAPHAPPAVESLVAWLLAKQPSARASSARDVIAAIDRLGPGMGDAARARGQTLPGAVPALTTLSSAAGVGSTVAPVQAPRRHGLWVGLGVGAVAAAVIAVMVSGGGAPDPLAPMPLPAAAPAPPPGPPPPLAVVEEPVAPPPIAVDAGGLDAPAPPPRKPAGKLRSLDTSTNPFD